MNFPLLRLVRRATGIALVSVVLLSGCAKSSDSSSGLSFSGTLGGSSSIIDSLRLAPEMTRGIIYRAVSFSGYSVACSTLDIPPTVVTGSVAADNTFALSLTPGTPYRCVLLNSSSEVVATFVFSDSNARDMSGQTQTIDTLALDGSASVSLSVDTASGQATGSVSELSMSAQSTASAFDFTGSYLISSLGVSLPAGYVAVCPSGSNNCNGPSEGESIYMRRIVGTSWNPDAQCLADLNTANTNGTQFSATCGGSAGSDTMYGITVWRNLTALQNCGTRLGFTYDEGKARARVDLSSSGFNSGDMTWASTSRGSGGGADTLSEGWKSNQAQSNWDIYNCQPFEAPNGAKGYKCTETATGNSGAVDTYNVNINEGCTRNGESEEPNWQNNVTWGGCTSTNLTGNMAGYQRQVCSATESSKTFSCTQVQGLFKISDNTAESDWSKFDWNSTKVVTSGTLCSAIPGGQGLQQMQCYANDYYQNVNSGNSNACLPDMRFNWTATDPTQFVYNDGPKKARNQHVMAPGKYLAGDTFAFRDSHTDWRGVRVGTSNGSNSYVNCRIRETFTMTLKKITDTEYSAVFVSESFNLSTDVASCVLNEENMGVGTPMRSMFKLMKQ